MGDNKGETVQQAASASKESLLEGPTLEEQLATALERLKSLKESVDTS
jgi:hypothetical protein